MAFAKKSDSLAALKKQLKKGSGGGTWIRYIGEDGLVVRFLQECEDWLYYDEHYDEDNSMSFPCPGKGKCLGCREGIKVSTRYLVNALEIDGDGNPVKVIPLKLTKDLTNRLVTRYEKWQTITNRDIELLRSGKGLQTQYDFDAEQPHPRKVARYELLDLEPILVAAYQDYLVNVDKSPGSTDDEDDDETKPVRSSRQSVVRRKSEASRVLVEDDDEDEDDDDEPVRKPVKRVKSVASAVVEDDEDEEDDEPPVKPAARRVRAATAPEPVFEPDEDEDDEDDDEPVVEADEDDDDATYTVEQLNAMTLGQLRATARDDFDIDPTGMSRKTLLAAIIDGEDAEEDDEDAPPF